MFAAIAFVVTFVIELFTSSMTTSPETSSHLSNSLPNSGAYALIMTSLFSPYSPEPIPPSTFNAYFAGPGGVIGVASLYTASIFTSACLIITSVVSSNQF